MISNVTRPVLHRKVINMSAIKNFFQKRKLDKKFKQAGEGHRLSEPSTAAQNRPGTSSHVVQPPQLGACRNSKSEGTSKAATAALARIDSQSKSTSAKPKSATSTWKNRSNIGEGVPEMQALKKDMKMEIRRDLQAHDNSKSPPNGMPLESSPILSSITFACPICPASLPENEIKGHIEGCLYRELASEPGMIAATMIHTLNGKEKVKNCIETLNRYLDNIMKSPADEKYRKIRKNNKVFAERVGDLKGVKEILTLAVGFVEVSLPLSEDKPEKEDFYLLSEGIAMETEKLEVIKSYLNEAEPLVPSLDRNVKVYEPMPGAGRLELPSEFYNLSGQEIKREQQNKSETLEKSKQLRTKAMREADLQNQKRIYKFTLIRIRFPDGHILEGTFYSNEKFAEVLTHVKESLENEWLPFELFDASGKKIHSSDETLEALRLSPAAILNFKWDQSIAQDAQRENVNIDKYLTEELLARKLQFY